MSIEAELPDGRVLEFPDGTDPAVIQQTVKKVLGVGQPAGIAANIGAGASRGFYGDVLGGPAELANLALRQVGLGSERPRGGTEDMRAVADYIASVPERIGTAVSKGDISPLWTGKSKRVEPITPNEAIAYSAGRAGGQAAGSIMGANVLQAATAPKTMANWLGKTFASQPATQVVSAATGGGVTEATDNPWLGLAAAVLTGGGIQAAKYGVKQVAAPLTEAGRKAQVGKAIAGFSRENADDLIRRLEARGDDLVAGSSRTTAEVTRNAGLANVERGLRNDPNQVTAFNNVDAARAGARSAQLTGAGPGGVGSPRVQQVIGQNVARYADAAGTTVDDIANAATQTANRATQGALPPQAAGAGIRAPFDQAYATARQATNDAYGAARSASAGVAVNPEPAYVSLARRVAEMYENRIENVPAEVTNTLQFLRSPNVTLEQLDNARQTLLRLYGSNKNSNKTLANIANYGARQIEGLVDDLVNSGQIDETAAQLWRNARTQRLNQGNVFERPGTTGELAARGEFGNTAINNSDVPGLFAAGRASPENMDDFMRALGNNPQAMRSMEGYLRDQARQRLFSPDGAFRPQAAQKWMRDYANVLDQFPQLRQELTEAVQRGGFADAVATTSQRGLTDLNRGVLGKIAGGGPDDAWQSIMAQNDPVAAARRVRTELGGNSPALKQAAIDWIKAKVTNSGDTLSAAKFAKTVDDMGPILRAAGFTPDEIRQIMAVGADLQSTAFAQNAGRAVGSNTVQNALTTRALNMADRIPVVGRNIKQNAVNAMTETMTDAMINPDAAAAALRAYMQQAGPGGILNGMLIGPSFGAMQQSLELAQRPPLRIVVTPR